MTQKPRMTQPRGVPGVLVPLSAFLAFLALALSWSLGTPLLSASDEPEQIVKAAATVRGEFSGPERVWDFPAWQSTYTTPDYLEVSYRLPHSLVRSLAEHNPGCYAFKVGVAADCTVKANAHAAAVAGSTASSHMDYSPLYYLLVGWPSLVLHGDAALYGMRVAGAVITALLLAGAFVTSVRRRGTAAVGVLAAATPVAVYYGAVVNPSGLEISSALLAWAAFLSLVRADPDAPGARRDRILFTAAAALLILVRPLGPVWLAMIVVLVAATAPRLRERLRRAMRGHGHGHGAWWAGGVLGAATLAAGAWDATQNTMGIVARINPHYTMAKGAYLTLAQTAGFFSQMLGLAGWNDVHVPTATTLLWYGSAITLLALSFALGDRRERMVLLALTALLLVFPIAFEAYSGAKYGVGWQGRYTLPLAVGLPILGAEILSRRLRPVVRATAPGLPGALSVTVGAMLAVAYLCQVWWAWRRYAQGLSGHMLPTPARWAPPIGWPTTLALAVAGCTGLLLLLRRSAAHEAAEYGLGADASGVDSRSADTPDTGAAEAGEPAHTTSVISAP